MADVTTSAAAMLLGRRSYEIFFNAWSEADRSEPAVAAMNQMPKYVATRASETPLKWENSTRLGVDIPREIARPERGLSGDLVVFGSGNLIHTLAEHQLVDEYRLLLFPVILGSGKRMFGDRSPFASFTLADVTTSATGVVLLTYTRA